MAVMKAISRILATSTAIIFASTAQAAPLSQGEPLPDLEAKNQDGKEVNLSEDAAKGYTLVYFYPKADTPGCTKQACSLRDSYEALAKKGVRIYGVSMDKEPAQKAFKEKYKLPFDLIADPEGKLVDAFGVPKAMGFSKRQAFLFQDGKLVWSDTSASTDKQAEDVLNVLSTR